MKIPTPPPAPWQEMVARLAQSGRLLELINHQLDDEHYRSWEWMKYHEPPQGMTNEEWWVLTRLQRSQAARPTPFTATDGTVFTYNLPGELLSNLETITQRTRLGVGQNSIDGLELTRWEYLDRALAEEALTSSQLEGASTSRMRAKEMLRSDRQPADLSERMILNNFHAMQRIVELADRDLTPALVLEIHRIVAQGTLEDPEDAGRLQRPGDARVRVYRDFTENQILHSPPPAEDLPGRLELLCDFANARGVEAGERYIPPILRAMTLHFMVGYEHYFADGNGRTARALFYWSMLHQGYHFAEFLPISRLLVRAPAAYAQSFLLTEMDDADLTHFFLAQSRILMRAIEDFDAYVSRKRAEGLALGGKLESLQLNDRQVAVLESMLRSSDGGVSVSAYQRRFGVVAQTARTDLQALERLGFLSSRKRGRAVIWYPTPDLAQRVSQARRG